MSIIMYDAVPDGVGDIPANARAVAGYIDGHYVSFPLLVKRFYPHAHCISIEIWGGHRADFADVEPGNPIITPAEVRKDFVIRRAMGVYRPGYYADHERMSTIVLPGLSGIPRHEYRLWLADWDGVAKVPAGYDAKQFTNNARNGREGPYDSSVCADSFWKPHPVPAPQKHPAVHLHPKVAASASTATLVTGLTALVHSLGVHITPAEAAAITTFAGTLAGYVKASR